MKRNRGFTLIELMVVIAVIGTLSAVILVSLNSTRTKARDSRRLQDVHEIKSALELYYTANGSYPRYDSGAVTCASGWADYYAPGTSCWSDLAIKLRTYLPVLSNDPVNQGGGSYEYLYKAVNNGQGYIFVFLPETVEIGRGDDCYGAPWYCTGVNWQ